ncbi:helix-turn-helix domain-containing protein [Rhizobium sullae]|uniref:helix-turn-helix domain-containing protein n=1 Tax=Rhizobium sullae TaxID=50338 RepID=UPI001FCE275C|nr:transcriptional regulator [Rhizobium sullae]
MLQWWIMSELRPIRSNEDYENALTLLKQLWGAPDGSPEADKLDILATLIDAYEASHYPIDLPDPIDAILFRMEQQGLSRKDLEPILGSRGRIAEISQSQAIPLEMIRRLHEHLGIPTDILIQPIRTNAA